MAIFKEVWQFISPGSNGGKWTETYYADASSLSAAASFPSSLLNPRLALLAHVNTLRQIRVSDILNPRVTTVATINQTGTADPNFTPAPTTEAMVIRLASSVVPARRFLWMRGQPDTFARRSALGNDELAFTAPELIANWIKKLAGNTYVVLPKRKASDPLTPRVKVSRVDGAVEGLTVLTLPAPYVGLLPGSRVVLTRFNQKVFPGLRGTFSVVAVAGATVTVQYTVAGLDNLVPGDGWLQRLDYIPGATIDPLLSGFAFLGGRQTNAPFSGSRGARRGDRGLRLSR